MANSTRCWWCKAKFAINAPKGSQIEIEPGQIVQVHKCCVVNVRKYLHKITAQQAQHAPHDNVPIDLLPLPPQKGNEE